MKKSLVPYDKTGYFSKAFIDYLNGAESLHQFYIYPPERSSFHKIIGEGRPHINRDILHQAVIAQHEASDKNSLKHVLQNIDLLKDDRSFTVTTAHQPNLFLGPLYLVYKIISVINRAKELSKEFPSHHFIPVYWMGSEDHDKEELNHIHLFGKAFTWNTGQEGAFGRMKTDSLSTLIEEIRITLGESENAEACITLLKDSYLQESTIAAATRKLLYHFFAKDGLVIVDGDDVTLKRLFIPVIEKEVLQQVSFPIVSESIERFTQIYPSQIITREINFFFLEDNLRQRIVKEGDQWKVLNTGLSFSKEELKALIHEHPEKFSPNVIMRPVYQVWTLPDISFDGGSSEVIYWLQLKPLFDHFKLPFPIVMPRNSALWIDAGNGIRMDKLGISPENIFLPPEILIRHYLENESGDLISLESQKALLDKLMQETLNKVTAVDSSLKGSVEAEKTKMNKSLEALEEKLRKALKKKEETAIRQIEGLKEKLFPANGLQERHDNFAPYYVRHGEKFLDHLKSNFNPFDNQFTVLMEE